MRKNILIVAGVALLTFATSAQAMEMLSSMGVSEQIDERLPIISTEGNSVTVQGASGMTLEVVSLTGRTVATYKIEGTSQRIELNLPKGCYILKIGKVARKVTVR